MFCTLGCCEEVEKEDYIYTFSAAPLDTREIKILDRNGGGGVVPGAQVRTISSASEAIAFMQAGARNRKVAATKANEESSRGHAIFLITVKKVCARETQNAQLYLVDLAGSEKADKTGRVPSSRELLLPVDFADALTLASWRCWWPEIG